jgi:hypothetical protein
MIELISPRGRAPEAARTSGRRLDTLAGRRLGFIWNQYPATRGFWPHLEREIEAQADAVRVERAYKSNTWMPLEAPRFLELATAVDCLVIGVGA